MGLPCNRTIPAVAAARLRLAKQTGMQILHLVREGIRPRDIMTQTAFENAIAVDMAIGGATDTVLHLPAIAHEAGVPLPWERFDMMSNRIPYLVKLSPSDPHRMQEFDEAGGVPAVMAELLNHGLLHCEARTVTGKRVTKNLHGACRFSEVIRPVDDPYCSDGGISILWGNLAPDGAVVKTGGVLPEMRHHQGPARVFEDEDSARTAILGGRIQAGDVVVIRYEGPRGGPGMPEILMPTSILAEMGLDDRVVLLTDSCFSGATRGAAVGYICPEAADGGPIALINEGDEIELDISNKQLAVRIDAEEMIRRREGRKPSPLRVPEGFSARYRALVAPANRGAVLRSR